MLQSSTAWKVFASSHTSLQALPDGVKRVPMQMPKEDICVELVDRIEVIG